MRYVVGHFLHVFTYILLTRVQLFIDKPRPFAQIEIDAGAHAQIFTTEGIPSGTEALRTGFRALYLDRIPENLPSLARLLADDAAVYRTILSHLDQTQLQQDLINRSENVLKVRYVLAFSDRPAGTFAEDGRPWAILTLNTISTDQQSPL